MLTFKTDGMQLPERIKAWRTHAGLTQQQLADRIGVGRTTVVMWEKASKQPSARSFDKLVRILSGGSHVRFYGKVPK